MKRNEVERQKPQAPSTNDLPLDEAAWEAIANDEAHPRGTGIAYLRDGKAHTVYSREMARAALTLRARVAELEAHANALRDALVKLQPCVEAYVPYRDPALGDAEGDDAANYSAVLAMRKAFAATPAASLAAYRKSVLEEAQARVVAALREYHEALTRNESFLCAVAVSESKNRAIRALAAQEVKP